MRGPGLVFELPPLPFGYHALEPIMSNLTLRVHHDQLHAGYVNRLNKIILEKPSLQGLSLEELLLGAVPGSPLAHNAGGHYNHSFLWKTLTPLSRGGFPGPLFLEAVDNYGGPSSFMHEFTGSVMASSGSYWVWAVMIGRVLEIVTVPDQQVPLSYGSPVLCFDAWEHAYLFDYESRKKDYAKNLWALMNYRFIESNIAAAL